MQESDEYQLTNCAFFNRSAILFGIQTVKKAATRATRIQKCIEMLVKHERIHP